MAEPKRPDNIVLENVRTLFNNFAGRQQQFNAEGDRNFCIILPPDKADQMEAEGWSVKSLKVREEGEVPDRYVKVKVKFGPRPPKIVLISSKGRVELGPDEVEILDFADIKNFDVVLNPYPWDIRGEQGITAYLKTAFVTLNEDELELKYAEKYADATGLSLVGDASDDLLEGIDDDLDLSAVA